MTLAGARPQSEPNTTITGQRSVAPEHASVLPATGISGRVDTGGIDVVRGEIWSTENERQWRYRKPRVRAPRPQRNRQFVALARWEGAVLEKFATYFVAEVIDLDSNERAVAEFDLEELSRADVDLCEPGSLFYWSIGYDVKESGQRNRASVIRFRRLGTE